MKQPIVLSINTAWNFVNFRVGLLRRLIQEGFEVVTVAPTDAHVDRLRDLGVRFVEIDIDRKGLSPLRDMMLLFRYRRVLKSVSPVAYLGWTIKPNIWGNIATTGLNIPTINNISGLGTAFMKTGPLQTVVRILYRQALRRSSTVFFQNPSDRNHFVKLAIVRAEQAVLLPGSGVDIEHFSPSMVQAAADQPIVFLMIARLLRDKGVREFVAAARILRAKGLNARFQIMGAIDQGNRSAVTLKELALWVEEGVIEHLSHCDDVRPVIAEADCIVLPSYREGMPRSLLEASAMAKPLVASDIPGCRPIARDKENAFLCRVKDEVSLADAMQRMAALPTTERLQMGRMGRLIAEREFDETLVIDQYISALDRAIKEPEVAN